LICPAESSVTRKDIKFSQNKWDTHVCPREVSKIHFERIDRILWHCCQDIGEGDQLMEDLIFNFVNLLFGIKSYIIFELGSLNK